MFGGSHLRYFAQLFRRFGDSRLLINVGTTVAVQLFEMRNIVSDRRIQINQRSTDSPHPERRGYFGAVGRNVDRSRKRLALGQARLWVWVESDVRDEQVNIARDPSDDESMPRIRFRMRPHAAHSLSPALGPT